VQTILLAWAINRRFGWTSGLATSVRHGTMLQPLLSVADDNIAFSPDSVRTHETISWSISAFETIFPTDGVRVWFILTFTIKKGAEPPFGVTETQNPLVIIYYGIIKTDY
jgi:hypothetical protein